MRIFKITMKDARFIRKTGIKVVIANTDFWKLSKFYHWKDVTISDHTFYGTPIHGGTVSIEIGIAMKDKTREYLFGY